MKLPDDGFEVEWPAPGAPSEALEVGYPHDSTPEMSEEFIRAQLRFDRVAALMIPRHCLVVVLGELERLRAARHPSETTRAEVIEALKLMMESHGMHGPCRHNSCSDCRDAYAKARAALAALKTKEGRDAAARERDGSEGK